MRLGSISALWRDPEQSPSPGLWDIPLPPLPTPQNCLSLTFPQTRQLPFLQGLLPCPSRGLGPLFPMASL